MRDVSVLVVGLGAMGSAALYRLAQRGAAPLGIEQFHIGHDRGSSHGRSRVFRTFYHDPLYVEWAQRARGLWQTLEAQSGRSLLQLNGLLAYAQPGNAALERNAQLMAALDVPHRLLNAAQVTARFPLLQPPPQSVACFVPDCGFLDADGCVITLGRQARAAGAVVHDRIRVLALELEQERPQVETSAGRYRCERLIVTAGPWAGRLLTDLGLPLQVTRQQKFSFAPRQPAAYGPDRLPIYANYDRMFYGFPCDGEALQVADDVDGPAVDPDTVDRNLDLTVRDKLGDWLAGLMPGLQATYQGGTNCLYTTTPDRDFCLGTHPQHPNVLIGAGFSGHGFKFAILVGQLLAELALGGGEPLPQRFRLDRFHRPKEQIDHG